MSCATAPPPRAESSARVKDSVPERVAAQRAAQRPLQLEEDDQRWGIDAAREREREQAAAKKKAMSAPTTPPPAAPPSAGPK